MATFIPNLRETLLEDVKQAYVDTPNFIYSDWLQQSENQAGKIGTISPDVTVGIVGAGPAGCAAAHELQKCGAQVTLFQSETDHIGGRLYSSVF